MSSFLVFLVALVLTLALTPPLARIAPRLGFLDQPDQRKHHSQPMPRIGGIAMVVGACGAAAFSRNGMALAPYLSGMVIIACFGAWDDRSDLNYRLKLLGQALASAVVIFGGGVLVSELSPLLTTALTGGAAIAASFFFLIAATNAVNLSDGLDGLAAGLSALSLGVLALMCQEASQFHLLSVVLALLGSCLGFLRFNPHPARLFMGDAGSQFLGFSLGILVLLVTHSQETPYSPVLPLFLLGVPFFDTLLVIIRRLVAGRSPFQPDRNHLHHRLLALGFGHYEVVCILYVAQAALVSSAFLLRFESDLLLLSLYIGFVLATALTLKILEKRQFSRASLSFSSPVQVKRSRWENLLSRVLTAAVLLGLCGFMLLVAAGLEWRGLWVVALILLSLLLVLSSRVLPLAVAPIVYLVVALIVYRFEFQLTHLASTQLANLYFFAMALLVVGGMRYSIRTRFEITTLDFLLILMVLAIPALGSPVLWGSMGGRAVAETVLLIYASELVRCSALGQRALSLTAPAALLAGVGLSLVM